MDRWNLASIAQLNTDNRQKVIDHYCLHVIVVQGFLSDFLSPGDSRLLARMAWQAYSAADAERVWRAGERWYHCWHSSALPAVLQRSFQHPVCLSAVPRSMSIDVSDSMLAIVRRRQACRCGRVIFLPCSGHPATSARPHCTEKKYKTVLARVHTSAMLHWISIVSLVHCGCVTYLQLINRMKAVSQVEIL